MRKNNMLQLCIGILILSTMMFIIVGCEFLTSSSNEDEPKLTPPTIPKQITPSTKMELLQLLASRITDTNPSPDLSDIDTSKITNMSDLFVDFPLFNGNISSWNVSNVTDMSGMFKGSVAFNNDISRWNVSKVEKFDSIFEDAISFKQDTELWKVKKSASITDVFIGSGIKAKDEPSWKTKKITITPSDYAIVLQTGKAFNSGFSVQVYPFAAEGELTVSTNTPLPTGISFSYDKENNTGILSAVAGTTVDTAKTNITFTFTPETGSDWETKNAVNIEQDISITIKTFTANPTTKQELIDEIKKLVDTDGDGNADNNSADLNGISTSAITDMSELFTDPLLRSFDGDISEWDVSNVTTMRAMFKGSTFNKDISVWDVSKVTDMTEMFYGANNFNKDIEAWNVASSVIKKDMFKLSAVPFSDYPSWNYTLVSSTKILNGTQDTAITDITFTFSPDNEMVGVSVVPTLPAGLTLALTKDAEYTAKISGIPKIAMPARVYTITFTNTVNNKKKISTDVVIAIKLTRNLTKKSDLITLIKAIVDVDNDGTIDFPRSNLNDIDVSGITDMSNLFSGEVLKDFHGNISKWDVSKVTNMSGMFQGSLFDGDISAWNINTVANFNEMFKDASNFKESLEEWNVKDTATKVDIFKNSGVTGALIPSWAYTFESNSISVLKGEAIATENAISVILFPVGAKGTYVVTPALPDGLLINDTGGIYGTPTTESKVTQYAVQFTGKDEYQGKSVNRNVSIAVANSTVSVTLTTNQKQYTFTKGVAISSITVTKDPSEATGSFTVSPTLPTGLSIDQKTGAISGTPSVSFAQAIYTITFTGIGVYVNATAQVNIAVEEPVNLTTSVATLTAIKRQSISPITVTKNPSAATGDFTVNPTLPTGLSIDQKTGAISGTPSVSSAQAAYTITFTGTGIYADATKQVSIMVKEPVNLTPSMVTLTAIKGKSIIPITVTKDPSIATGSFTVNPTLPAGLSIDQKTGAISGTPSVLATQAAYAIEFAGTGVYADATAQVTLIVKDQEDITPSVATLTATKNQRITPITITKKDSAATGNFTISPLLPAGLSIDKGTGEISGIPSVSAQQKTYTIHFTGTGGHSNATAQVSITVEEPVNLTTSVATLTAIKGQSITSITVTKDPSIATGSFTVNPSLPIGLSIDQKTGAISGTPSVSSAQAAYTITFTGTGIYTDATKQVSIAVKEPVNLTTSVATLTATKGKSITPITVTKNPSAATGSFTVSPSLPTGLSIDQKTGAISGTPSVSSAQTTYTITFTGTGIYADATKQVSITVEGSVNLTTSVATLTATKGQSITPITVTKNPSVATGNFSVNPSLPIGLSIDQKTGAISGTPSVSSAQAVYTITFTGTGVYVNATAKVNIAVEEPVNLTTSVATLIATKGQSITPITVTKNPSAATGGFTVSPSLPTGLSIDQGTGAISGTPSVLASQATYTITFTGTGIYADATKQVSIAVKEPVNLTTNVATLTAIKGKSITPITVTKNPSAATGSFTVSPSLPAGLSIDQATGAISGTPSALASQATYTITFTGTGVYTDATKTVTITVLEAIVLSTKVTQVYAIKDASISPFFINKSISSATGTFSVSPSFPTGISIDNNTGAISGIPTVVQSSKQYTITFTASGAYTGQQPTIQLSIIVNSASIDLVKTSYSKLVKGRGIKNIEVKKSPSSATGTFSVNPSFPTGISMDTNTGIISGTPSVTSNDTAYTITFTGSGIYTGEIKTVVMNMTIIEIVYDHTPSTVAELQTAISAEVTKQGTNSPDLKNIDTSNMTSFRNLFNNNKTFNGDVSYWDTSNVTNMEGVFNQSVFNGDISSWDVSSVQNMGSMFYDNSVFNGDISSWDVSSVNDMQYMFSKATAFNQSLNIWDTSSVINMKEMFSEATVFNQPLHAWNVGSVTNMVDMFKFTSFNKSISDWDVSSVKNMGGMFNNNSVFNQDISGWDVGSITDMRYIFYKATAFSQDIYEWKDHLGSRSINTKNAFTNSGVATNKVPDWAGGTYKGP